MCMCYYFFLSFMLWNFSIFMKHFVYLFSSCWSTAQLQSNGTCKSFTFVSVKVSPVWKMKMEHSFHNFFNILLNKWNIESFTFLWLVNPIQLRRCRSHLICYISLIDWEEVYFLLPIISTNIKHISHYIFQDLTVNIQELEKQKAELETALRKVLLFLFMFMSFIWVILRSTKHYWEI